MKLQNQLESVNCVKHLWHRRVVKECWNYYFNSAYNGLGEARRGIVASKVTNSAFNGVS